MTRCFRPSRSSYWSKCAAYQRFTSDMPKQKLGDSARGGICAAWLANKILKAPDEMTCSDLIGEPDPSGWLVTSEMAADVQLYVDLVRSYGGEVTGEELVTASKVPLIEGRLDSSITIVTDGILRIIDLKYGRSSVETTASQLICYGYAKFLKTPARAITEIHLSIYQPRSFHVDGIYRTRVVTPEQLTAEFKKLFEMALEGEKPDSFATAGPHCSDCQAAAGCLTLAHTSYKLIEFVSERDHREMSANELSRELDLIEECEKTILARFKAVKAEAEARVDKEFIPGWSKVAKLGNSVFNIPGTTVQLLTGVDPWKKTICTPAELIRRGATEAEVKNITVRPSIGRKLSRITANDVAKMFKIKPS